MDKELFDPIDPNEPVTPQEKLHWAAEIAQDEWYTDNLFDENGEQIDLRLLLDDERELEDEY